MCLPFDLVLFFNFLKMHVFYHFYLKLVFLLTFLLSNNWHAVECSLAQDVGNCTDVEAAWAFSQSENRCVPFYYTGCGGNENRFNSLYECEEDCPSAYGETS